VKIVHELIWPPLGLLGLAAARWLPLDQLGFVCPFHFLTGFPCVGCGGTRAALALARGDLARAFEMNPLAALAGIGFVIYLGIAVVALVRRRPYRPQPTRRQATLLRVGAVGAIAANWIYLIAVGR
jgi:hypothetical protein